MSRIGYTSGALLIAFGATVAMSTVASAQLNITEPVSCRLRRTTVVTPGKPVQVKGSAKFARQVFVDGQSVDLRSDPGNPDYSLFETALQPGTVHSVIRVRLIPTTGADTVIECKTDVPEAVVSMAGGQAGVTRDQGTSATRQSAAPLVPMADLWGPFHQRSLWYGIGAAAGIAVAAAGSPPAGGVLIGAGLVAFAIDAIWTSNKADKEKSTPPQ